MLISHHKRIFFVISTVHDKLAATERIVEAEHAILVLAEVELLELLLQFS